MIINVVLKESSREIKNKCGPEFINKRKLGERIWKIFV